MSAKKKTKKTTTAKRPAKVAKKKAAPKRATKATKKGGAAARVAQKRATKKPAKAQAKKKTARSAAKKKSVVKARTKPAVRRRDRPGHLDPKYAADLRARSRETASSEDVSGFVDKPRTSDDLAEALGEEVVEKATTGEDEGEDVANQDVPEELGGPFVLTSAGAEFAEGTDESNPDDARREPFPRT